MLRLSSTVLKECTICYCGISDIGFGFLGVHVLYVVGMTGVGAASPIISEDSSNPRKKRRIVSITSRKSQGVCRLLALIVCLSPVHKYGETFFKSPVCTTRPPSSMFESYHRIMMLTVLPSSDTVDMFLSLFGVSRRVPLHVTCRFTSPAVSGCARGSA